MKKNVGDLDSVIRLTLAVLITLLYLFNVISTITAGFFLVIGVVLLFTSILKHCPIYAVFSISSLKQQRKA